MQISCKTESPEPTLNNWKTCDKALEAGKLASARDLALSDRPPALSKVAGMAHVSVALQEYLPLTVSPLEGPASQEAGLQAVF